MRLEREMVVAEVNATGKRYCTNCNSTRPAEGGVWKILNNGRNRRWKCQSCYEKNIARAASTAEDGSMDGGVTAKDQTLQAGSAKTTGQ